MEAAISVAVHLSASQLVNSVDARVSTSRHKAWSCSGLLQGQHRRKKQNQSRHQTAERLLGFLYTDIRPLVPRGQQSDYQQV